MKTYTYERANSDPRYRVYLDIVFTLHTMGFLSSMEYFSITSRFNMVFPGTYNRLIGEHE